MTGVASRPTGSESQSSLVVQSLAMEVCMSFVRLLAAVAAFVIVLAQPRDGVAADPVCEGSGEFNLLVETWACGPESGRQDYCESQASTWHKDNCDLCVSDCWYDPDCDDDV